MRAKFAKDAENVATMYAIGGAELGCARMVEAALVAAFNAGVEATTVRAVLASNIGPRAAEELRALKVPGAP